ncbi:MAG: hypothetical protein GY937_04625 [bacterium]|nr:hypothetical protein [bacterium]
MGEDEVVESRLKGLGAAWIPWVPAPVFGLPVFLGIVAVLAYGTIELGLPRGLFTLLAMLVPFIATQWGRAPVYLAILSLFVAGVFVARNDGDLFFQTLQRASIQIVALALITEIVRSTFNARDRTATALAESEERYRSLVESLNVIPFEFDLATMRFSYVGPQAKDALVDAHSEA